MYRTSSHDADVNWALDVLMFWYINIRFVLHINCLLVWVDCVSWVILEMELGDVEDRLIVINCSKSCSVFGQGAHEYHTSISNIGKNKFHNGVGHVLSWHSWMCGGIYKLGSYDFWSQLCPWEPSVLNSKMCRLHCNWVSLLLFWTKLFESTFEHFCTAHHSLEGLSVFFRIEKSSEEWDACWLTQKWSDRSNPSTYIIFTCSICQALEWESVEV